MKETYKTILPLLAFLLPSVAVTAAPVSPELALERLRKESPARIVSISSTPLRLAHTLYAGGESSVYVFNSTDGFVVAPADDLAPAVLGYSDSGEFSPLSAPPGLIWLLGEYSRQIDYCRQHNLSFNQAPDAERDPVLPLVKSQWNQDAPFNNLCPEEYGVKCYVGCVATATAQVVNYHRCPAGNGTGTYTYNWNGQEISFDYGATRFDWDNMALTYPYNESEYPGTAEEIDTALATLSYACGVGVNMGYSSIASGAYAFRIPRMLSDHFGYDIGFSYLKRDFFGFREWNDMMYAEVAAGRPILYAGTSDGGGHEFICDGYSSDNMFHINWGWSGLCDGYYLLAALNPSEQGIGGSTTGSGFSMAQDAVIGIQPAKEGSYRRVPMFAYGPFTPIFDEEDGQWYFNFLFGESVAYYFSDRPMDIYIGLRIEDQDGNSVYCYGEPIEMPGIGEDLEVPGIDKFTAPYQNLDLAPGIYTVWPAMKEINGEWQDMRTWFGTSNHCQLTVAEDGSKSFQYMEPDIKGEIRVGNIKVRNQGSGQEAPIFTLEFENVGEMDFDDIVMLQVLDPDGSEVLSETGINLKLKPQQTLSRNLRWNPFVPAGDYDFVVKDKEGSLLSQIHRLHLDAVDYPVLNVTQVDVPEPLPAGKRSNIILNVDNIGNAAYKGDMMLLVYQVGETEVLTEKKFTAEIPANSAESCEFKWKPELSDGQYEIGFVNSNGQKISGRFLINIGDSNGVYQVAETLKDFQLYSIEGYYIGRFNDMDATRHLPSGLYIVRADGKTYKLKR